MDEVSGYLNSNTVTGKDTYDVLEAHSRHFRWSGGERVLDIGCGPGDVTANIILPFLPKDCTLVGCDLSAAMLENCKKYQMKGKLNFKKLDIQQKRLDKGWENLSFDKIFSFYCLHWVTDHRQALKNIYSLLKPGGEILLMFLTPDNAVYIAFELLKESPKWNSYVKDVEWFYKSKDSISLFDGLLGSVGFQEIECYLKKAEHHIASWSIYMELMKSVNPFLRHIPDAMKSEFIEELEDLLKQQNHIRFDDVGEGITIEYNLIVTSAKKTMRWKSMI